MIPKIIHYCWFGRKPLPKSALKCISSWRKFFPDYEIKKWNEDNFDVHSIPYIHEAYECGKYAFVSDYARFWVLYHYGGIYFDTDVEVIRNMDHIIIAGNFMGFEKNLATETLNRGTKLGVNPGLGIGAIQGLQFFKEVLEFYEGKPHFDINEGTVVDYTTDLLRKHGLVELHQIQKIDNINIYTADYFCPMDSTTGIITQTQNTVSIHHYSCSWMDHNTFSWRLHLIKNWLISVFGDKLIMSIRNILKR